MTFASLFALMLCTANSATSAKITLRMTYLPPVWTAKLS
jgi:hypothetical protein